MTIREKRDRFIKLKSGLVDLGIESLQETKNEFLALNVDQLKHGKRSDGEQIGRYALGSQIGREYAKYKYGKNPLAGFGNVDLINTKDFIDGLDIVMHGKSFEEFSHDVKQNLLVENYGPEIFGLQTGNKDKYRGESFMPVLRSKASEVVNG